MRRAWLLALVSTLAGRFGPKLANSANASTVKPWAAQSHLINVLCNASLPDISLARTKTSISSQQP